MRSRYINKCHLNVLRGVQRSPIIYQIKYLTRKSCGKSQEAYHPRHNLCKPHLVQSWMGGGTPFTPDGGTPTRTGWCTPPPIGELDGGNPPPPLGLDGRTPGQDRMGLPPPHWDWVKAPPPTPPPRVSRQIVSKHYLPSYFVRRR